MHVPCKRWKATHNDKWGPWHIKWRVLGCWYVFFLKLLFLLFNLTFYSFIGTKAAAWAKPSRSQAVTGGFGLAWGLTKPNPPQARPKPRLPGQAGPCTALAVVTVHVVVVVPPCCSSLAKLINKLNSKQKKKSLLRALVIVVVLWWRDWEW